MRTNTCHSIELGQFVKTDELFSVSTALKCTSPVMMMTFSLFRLTAFIISLMNVQSVVLLTLDDMFVSVLVEGSLKSDQPPESFRDYLEIAGLFQCQYLSFSYQILIMKFALIFPLQSLVNRAIIRWLRSTLNGRPFVLSSFDFTESRQ